MEIEIIYLSNIETEETKRDAESGDTPDLIEIYWDETEELDFEHNR